MEYIIERLTEALAEGDLPKAAQVRDELTLSRDELAPSLHLLAETLCYHLEKPADGIR